MKVKIDNNADALYIYIQEKFDIVSKTIMADEFYDLKWMINFDIDINWNIIWIEIIPINFIKEIKNLKFKVNNNSLILLFSDYCFNKKYSINNDDIVIYLDHNNYITSIEINNIFNSNNFSNIVNIEF